MAAKYLAVVEEVVDGDTFHGKLIVKDIIEGIDLTFNKQAFRFNKVQCPEKNQKGYYEAKEYTASKCDGKTLEVNISGGIGEGGFGRWLTEVFYEENGEVKHLNSELLELGLAVSYKKK